MKHLLLLSCLISGSSLAAQQNDMVNIDSLIQQRIKDEINSKLNFPLLKAELNDSTYTFSAKDAQQTALLRRLPGGEGLLILPTDHMPCVVPDMRKFQSMPVKGNTRELRIKKGAIPNPAPVPAL